MKEIKTNLGRRTDFDFSEHELLIKESDGLLVHTLKHKDYNKMYRFDFINTNGVMVVTGDYGNWMFCREFHPSPDGMVSDYYWCEKIKIASTQEPFEFDYEATEKEILEAINGGLVEGGFEGDDLEIMTEYYESLLDKVHEGEFYYEAYAYGEMPYLITSGCVPNNKKIKHWLLCVFDAFEEICSRLKEGEEK
jgi:hypothetical protein